MTVAVVKGLIPDPLASWRRDITCLAVAHARGPSTDVNTVAQELYGVEKAVVVPSSTSTASALSVTAVGEFLRSLRPKSASARLFARSLKVSLLGVGSIAFPAVGSALDPPQWIVEGDPLPVGQATLAAVALGPTRKLALITALTGELAGMGAESAEQIISLAMEEAVALGLDSAVFSNVAASSSRPAGLLNATAPLTPTAGGGQGAMIGDLQKLAAAIAAAGGGASLMVAAAPAQAIALAAQVEAGFDSVAEIVSVPSLAAGTVVMIEVGAIVYSLDELPRVEATKAATIHMEDTTPAAIGTPGSPNVVAAPVRSFWQTDVIGLRIILRATWAVRAAGMVQHIVATTW